MKMEKIKIFLADEHTVFRQGLKKLLEVEPAIEIVGEGEEQERILKGMKDNIPHVVLLDVAMGRLGGIKFISKIKKAHPDVKIVVLSTHGEDESVLKSLFFGASSYLVKDITADELIHAIKSVHMGGAYFCRSIAAQITDYCLTQMKKTNEDRIAKLTPRETEIMQYLTQGLKLNEIAKTLGLSVKTVEVHKTNLMRKLDLKDRTDLIRFAFKNKIIT